MKQSNLLNAQFARRLFRTAFSSWQLLAVMLIVCMNVADLNGDGQCDTSGSNSIYVRSVYPSGNKHSCSGESHYGACGEKGGY